MRTLLVVLAILALALPAAHAKPLVTKIQLDKHHTFTLSVNHKYHPNQTEFMGFKLADSTGPLVETKGDPMLFLGGKHVGFWSYKHMAYQFKNGLKIVGHADRHNGNPHSFEIYHLDGTMTLIRNADTDSPKIKKYGKWASWLWKKANRKHYHTFIVN